MTQPDFEPDAADSADAAMVLMAVRDDAGPFHHLGSQFKCNKTAWIGKAVASPVAIYLLKKSKNSQGYGGGLVGAMLSAALASDDGLNTCAAADLPAPIRAVIDPKSKLSTRDVIIIPRATVSFIKDSALRSTITVEAGSDKFRIFTSIFSMFARPKALRAMGWVLETRLTPTAAPVHDTRSYEQRVAGNSKPLWIKILLILGAIGLIILVIAIRIAAEH